MHQEEKPRPRLSKLIIKNFRCIGKKPVEIELDDIVVLVGPNNVGKSSILRAYEVIMAEGSKEGQLTLDDFPNSIIDENNYPEIELHTVVYDDSPGKEWIEELGGGENLIKERWTWNLPGEATRRGFNTYEHRWANDTDKEKMPWGAPGIANSRRPLPHHIDAFSSPENQAKTIIGILDSVIDERIAILKESTDKEDYKNLVEKISEIRKKLIEESQIEISRIEAELSRHISRIFPGYAVKYLPNSEQAPDITPSLFKGKTELRMGPEGGYLSAIAAQGSGARRALLWTALKLVAESKKPEPKKKPKTEAPTVPRPHVLLLDEPEICLHPNAIREACSVLYELPSAGNWQVMITTHSPCFIDISRDNTSIIRVEVDPTGEVSGTTIFRPKKSQLSADDKEELKLLNLFDPYVAEFFFGGKVIVVEGDTEYTVFKYVISKNPNRFKDVHIIRARGKATIVSLTKILNHFGSSYSILHDSDTPKVKRKGKEVDNPAWTMNNTIFNSIKVCPSQVRLVTSIPYFEKACFNEEAGREKPYNALQNIRSSEDSFKAVSDLLDSLIDHTKPVPNFAFEWRNLEDLAAEYEKRCS